MKLLALFVFLSCNLIVVAQLSYQFSPGFIAQECDDLLVLNEGFADTTKAKIHRQAVPGYQFLYRSKPLGFDNVWDLWLRSDSTVVITNRGTTTNPKSAFSNLYCAMMPHAGIIHLNDSTPFMYQIAGHIDAAVHAGFLAGFAFIARDAKPYIDSFYQAGYRKFLISGHSQGGAISNLMSSWLYYLEKEGIYAGIQIKNYTFATPKMGNMYYVYDFDHIMRGEWAFSVTNSNDMIPEVPFTTQQMLVDVNEPNPIHQLKDGLKSRKFIERVAIKYAVNNMRRKAEKSSKSYQKFLGKYTGKMLKDMVPGLSFPSPVNSTYFLRPGTSISLMPNDAYQKYFQGEKNPYFHHLFPAYRFLLRQQYLDVRPM